MTEPATPHIVVIGSGLAGFGVLRELRKLSPDAKLTLVTVEDGHFYSKPALSTALAKGKKPETLITTPAEKMTAQLKLDLRAGCAVESIDRAGKVIHTTDGPIAYDALVLALGAEPIRPAIAGDGAGRAVSVNTLEDYRAFRERLTGGARVLVMGSGLVGTEFANDLAATGYKAAVVDMLEYPLARFVPHAIGERVRDSLAAHGVEWFMSRRVNAIHSEGAGIRAELDDGTEIKADMVLSAVGLRPRTELAVRAGLNVKAGILVDEAGRTSDPDIFAVGDCAQYQQGLAAYVTPIMAAARAIAPSVLGKPATIHFPPLSVQVKTTFCPVVLLPAPAGVEGAWSVEEDDAEGLKYLFRDHAGTIRGYAMTDKKCDTRMDMDRALSALHEAEKT